MPIAAAADAAGRTNAIGLPRWFPGQSINDVGGGHLPIKCESLDNDSAKLDLMFIRVLLVAYLLATEGTIGDEVIPGNAQQGLTVLVLPLLVREKLG